MGKKRVLGLLVIVAALVTLSWQIWRNREPEYDGKPLSFWLSHYELPNPSETSVQAADHALQSMGTNALPLLLDRIKVQDSILKLRLHGLLAKQHIINVQWKGALEQRIEARFGFLALGGKAKPAVPNLEKAYSDSPSPEIQCSILEAIGAIGPAAKEAVPMLVSALTNSAKEVRVKAAEALGPIHSEPGIAVPALAGCLAETNSVIGAYAVVALMEFGTNAQMAIPILTHLLNHENTDVRRQAFVALEKIDPASAAKVQAPSQ